MTFLIAKRSAWLCGVVLLAGWAGCPFSVGAEPKASVLGVDWHRETDDSAWIASLRLSNPCPPERARIFLDIDGPDRGGAGLGADLMVEGPHLFRHAGDGDWSWTRVGAAVSLQHSNRISIRIAPAPKAETVRAVVELTGEDWSIQSRFPPTGLVTLTASALPRASWPDVTGVSAHSARTIESIEPFRAGENGLGFRVTVSGAPDPSCIRILIDTNQAQSGWGDAGIDVMSEGAGLYHYPGRGQEWRWEPLGDVIASVASNQILMVLNGIDVSGPFRWYAERFTPAWDVVERYPEKGLRTHTAETLAMAPTAGEPAGVDIAELLKYQPESLSRRLMREESSRTWQAIEPSRLLPTLSIPGFEHPASVRLEVIDAVSGERFVPVPDAVYQADGAIKWTGALDTSTSWWLMQTGGEEGALELIGAVQSSTDRCLRVTVGLIYPEAVWTWHDDMSYRSVMSGGRTYAHDHASPYGLMQRRSYYPFGVVSTTGAVLVAETDGREPRMFQIEARSADRMLAIHYDLASTPQTGHFPGMAAFQARFRAQDDRTGVNPFRAALQSWYDRDPDWHIARAPKHGLWLPFTDIASIHGAEDFQFAFFEKVGTLGSDVDAARAAGVLNFPYTEPWLYWLPLSDPSSWNRTAAVQRMKGLAVAASGQARDFAASGYLGASRDAALNHRISFLNTPWSNGGRMEVNTDPELPTAGVFRVNRAMAEWRYIRSVLDDPRVDGIYLDSMSAMETIDYNPAALSVADYPATFVMADLKPGLSMPVQAVEFTAALGRALHAKGKLLMANFPCWKFPFFMPYIDVPGEETTWYSGNRFTPLSGRELNYRRAISGSKPFGFLQATHFDTLTRTDMEKYFRECLFFAFMPSFFSHDGANDPYWVDAAMYERDRPLFRKYLPITIRLSEAGWLPVPHAQSGHPSLRLEQFGRVSDDVFFLTLRNTTEGEVDGEVAPDAAAGTRVMYDLFSGRLMPGAVEVFAAPESITCLLAMTPVSVAGEAARMRAWADRHFLYEAAARNLESFVREGGLGVQCTLEQVAAVVGDEPARFRLSVENRRSGSIDIAGDESAMESFTVAPGETKSIDWPAARRMHEEGWVRVSWSIRAGGRTQAMERIVVPAAIQPYAIKAPPVRVAAAGASAQLEYVVAGRRTDPADVTLAWQAGSLQGTQVQAVAMGRPALFRIEIPPDERNVQLVNAVVSADGRVMHESSTYVVFSPDLRHPGMDPEVRISADSAYSGYAVEVVRDGVVETEGLNWNEAAFATAESSEPHWIRYHFRTPATVSALTVHWNREGGVTYASRCGEVWATLDSGEEIRLGAFTNDHVVANNRIDFAPRSVRTLELRQPPSCGSAARPGILWVSELEIE